MKKLTQFVVTVFVGFVAVLSSGCAVISPQYPPGTMMYDGTGQLVPVPQTFIVMPWYANLPDANYSVGYWGSGGGYSRTYYSSGHRYGGGHHGGGHHHDGHRHDNGGGRH